MAEEQFAIDIPLEGDAIQVRDASKRELDIRLFHWGEVIQTAQGTEEFVRGEFNIPDPSRVRLMGMEHAAQIGLGQDGKPVLVRVPTGKGTAYEDRDDGPVLTVRVARTSAGDDQLTLAEDGLVTGASVEFTEVPGGTIVEKRGNRRHRRHLRADVSGITTTYRPAYSGGSIVAMRSEEEPVTEQAVPEVPATPPVIDMVPFNTALDAKFAEVFGRMEAMEEQARSRYDIPAAPLSDDAANEKAGLGDWASIVFRMLTGEKISQKELQTRVAAELITTDNLGVVPEQFLSEIIGIIDPARPFLNSTRRLNTPAAGMTFNVPVITTRPTVGIQAAEKDELTSTPTAITDTSFTPLTIGGYGDISIQLLRRSDPSYLDLYVELLAEAYAIMADDRAVDALLAASGINTGAAVDPLDGPRFGDAWANGAGVSTRLTPDTIWLSSDAVRRFIDAVDTSTTQPIYGNLAGSFSASGGPGGNISGLRPVHVPALDDESYDIIVGPSRGFAWAEDGTFTLQVDVPALAGREVALVGMIWNMPLYPAAFTRYALTAT